MSSPAALAREERVIHHLNEAIPHDIPNAAAVDEAIGIEQREVSRNDRRRDAPVLRGRLGRAIRERVVTVTAGYVRDAAAHEIVIDDIIVHNQRRVEQLERRTNVRGCLEVGATEGLVGAEDHARAETLAARSARLELFPELHILRPEGGGTVLG